MNQQGDWWNVRVQGNAEHNKYINNNSNYNLNNSYVAAKVWNQWLMFGQIPQWWGPGYEGSLIRSDASRPMTGFLLQRAAQTAPRSSWLSWIGPWQYQIMASQINQYDAVPHAKIVGGRFTFSPTPSLDLGVSRVLQWAGKNRPSDGRTLWDGIVGNNNEKTSDIPGNSLAGFEFKYKLAPQFKLPISLYGQMIGEHMTNGLPSDYMYIAGVDGMHNYGVNTINWYVEYHNTHTNFDDNGDAYQHRIYRDGYYQQGYSLGDAIGGDGEILVARTELVTPENDRWSVRVLYGRVNPLYQTQNKAFPVSRTLTSTEVGWSGDIYKTTRLGTKLWYTDYRDADFGAGVNVEIPFSF
jgi:hypothetical protein